jgi:hypothetical protein
MPYIAALGSIKTTMNDAEEKSLSLVRRAVFSLSVARFPYTKSARIDSLLHLLLFVGSKLLSS